MTTTTWKTKTGHYMMDLDDPIIHQIDVEIRTGPQGLETGGILVGLYDDSYRLAIVSEALPPPDDSISGRDFFHRGTAGLADRLSARWDLDPRTYYIGEWHHHPVKDVEPSDDDFATMRSIQADEKYQCPQPIMIIAGRGESGGVGDIRAFVFVDGGEAVELYREGKS